MPHKIVQTIEGGEACLSVVPSRWEVKGILHWPKKHLVAKLQLEEDSVPSDKWEKLNCIKKREFATRAEAYDELKKMEEKSDTEVDEQVLLRPQRQRHQRVEDCLNFVKQDFNEIAEASNQPQTKNYGIPTDAEEIIFVNTIDHLTELDQTQLPLKEQSQCSTPYIVYVDPASTVQNLESTQLATIINNQMHIMENQDNIMQAQAKLLTYSEYVLQSIKENPIGAWPLPATHVEAMMDPIATLDNLEQLEASLKDESTMQKYIQSMSCVCGNSGKSNGIDCCYKLVHYFITRQFLLQCSWTGGSRGSKRKNGEQSTPGITNEETEKVGLKLKKNSYSFS
uniref:DUF4806 domain-containing protein n=1 Tax=Anopheles gambiae TaxID=7165 RepID=A0A1S4GAW0_ANOGA